MSQLVSDEQGIQRCRWSSEAPEFLRYHDEEWGQVVKDDYKLFEKICLESFQSGLSWRTILVKRENFREAFLGFDFDKLALFTEQDIALLMQNKGIIRNRRKIESVINNAKRAQELIAEHGSLSDYLWRYQADPKAPHIPQSITTSPLSIAMANDLKKRGWKFIGPTTAFAFMQAMGFINDHVEGCFIREQLNSQQLNMEQGITD